MLSNLTLGKAGRSRWLGRRPTVRGIVMNPVDHPHGGGEGRAPIGRSRPCNSVGASQLWVIELEKQKNIVMVLLLNEENKIILINESLGK